MKILVIAAGFLAAVSCSKKDETQIATSATDSTTVTADHTVTVTDSAAISPTVVASDSSTVTEKYVSDDGKTEFTAVFNPAESKAVVTNKTTGTVYHMTSAVSGSGAKFTDKDGNFFWEHQGEFTFGKDGKDQIQGKVSK